MSVRILDRKYTNQFDQTSKTTFPCANTGDVQRITLDFGFSVEIKFSAANPLLIVNPDTLSLSSGNWGDFGFASGQTCTLQFVAEFGGQLHPNFRFFTIGIINGSDMQALSLTGLGQNVPNNLTDWYYPQQTMPYQDSGLNVRDVRIYVDAPMQGIHLDYTHLTNKDAPSGGLLSFHDGTKTSFQAENTDDNVVNGAYPLGIALPFTHTLAPYRSGMSIIKATVMYLGVTGIEYKYRLEVVFMWSSFYDTYLNYKNGITPDALLGSESLTDAFQVIGMPVYNNPNVSVKNIPKKSFHRGNVGWFDENFNQLPNLMEVTDVLYKDLSGNTVGQLDYANPVTVTATIKGVKNLAYGLSKFQYGFQWVNLEEEANDPADGTKKNIYPYYQNTKISTGGEADLLNDVFPLFNGVHSAFPSVRAGYSHDGATMDASDIVFDIAPNLIDVIMSVTFRPNAAFATFMDDLSPNERQYKLWVSAGDRVPDTNQSDRVSLSLDFNEMKTFIAPIGEYPGLTIDFLDHPQAYDDTPVLCGNSIYVEDDLLAKVKFRVDTAASPDIPIPQKIVFGVVAERASDSFQYVLDKNEADLTQFPDPTQYNFNQPRNFKLGVGNSKNRFQVDYDATNDSGTEKGVLGWYGWKCRWESWIERFPTAPQDFYDNTLEQNGKNNNWFDYFDTNGWTIKFFVDIYATLDGTTVKYQNLKLFTIRDYDDNSTITTELKYYRNNNGVKGGQITGGPDPELPGKQLGLIIEGEKVFLDIIYTSTGAAYWPSQVFVDDNVYATNCIEVDKDQGGQLNFRQLSSIWSSENDNPMVGIPTETLSIITRISDTEIIVSSMIDADKLPLANKYEVTGRQGCK